MSIWRMISLVIAIVAVVGVFVEIPIVSDYAFWILVVALIIWQGAHAPNTKNWFRYWQMLDISLLILAIVAVFAYIPILSDYAFWFLAVAYLIASGSTSFASK
jgi:hypothetical protein